MSYQLREEKEDTRRIMAYCSFCGREIKAGNEDFYGDEAYFDHGAWSCENCKEIFLKTFRVDTEGG